MRKYPLIILVVLAIVLFLVSCAKEHEIQNDVDTLKYYLEDLPIESCSWCEEVKRDRFAGVGPTTYIFYGMAELDEDYCIEIFNSYEWELAKQDDILEELASLKISNLNLNPDNYYVSESYNDEINNNISLKIWLDVENNIILFYREFQDF